MSGGVMLYVQHLLGVGHLKRMALLARRLAAMEVNVDVVSGGRRVPGLDVGGARLHQLAPLAMGRDFRDLIDETGSSVDDAWKGRRHDALLGLHGDLAPGVLVLELFPFGRAQMAFELLPLLEAAHARRPRPVIVSSVRDMLQTGRAQKRLAETVERVEAWVDHVLVHADADLARIDETFPRAAEIAGRLHYTGLIADIPEAAPGGRAGVVVSAGGGKFSEPLLAAAMEARPLSRLADAPWRLIAGPNLEADAVARLRARAGPGILVEPFRGDFPGLLARTQVSISRAGYNTVADVLGAGPRAVLVPFTGAGETEQRMRAERLAARGLAQVVDDTELSAAALAQAVDAAMGAAPTDGGLDLQGAARSAALIKGWLGGA